ncbi:GNAT family N-acetyltransferase [Devosia sp.]|uniref:GNAT family N-acetyltransferase n=1 Tax=Devosia sp. TaxID=1871048 RepID=UPI00344C6976
MRAGRFVGTVTSIMDDIGARPDWGPCLAALWVEPDARGQGIGAALAEALMARLAGLGFERVYLSAKPHMRDYYLLRGWTMIDSDIDKDRQDVFLRLLPRQ